VREAYAPIWLVRTVSVSIVLLALAGCNQNNKTSSAPSPPSGAAKAAASGSTELDACTLVTKAEAEAAMGEHLKDGESGPASMRGGEICMYESPDTLSARHITVRVEAPNFDWNKYKEERQIEGEKMRPKRGYIRPVPGLGKDAYFARHTLHVLTDKGTLTVIVFKDAADAAAGEEVETKAESAEKTLAQKALSRM
jgi:Protein of unknown function (DUF3558)